jgi:hypothetical protein
MVSCRRCLFTLALMLLGSATVAQAGEQIQVGVAESDITPPKGFLMAGYYHERLARHDRST